jgi:hypothetical protein
MTTDWTYESMYNWYTKQGKIRDPLYEIVYSVIYDAKKPSKKDNNLEPFIKRNIVYVGESPVQDNTIFPNNLYLAYDDNKTNQKWLYFIHPLHIICDNNDTILSDHLTFVLDPTDKEKSCHFHTTKYFCVSGFTKWEYTTKHTKDYIPDKISFTNNDFSLLFQRNSDIKNIIVNIMKHPWNIKVGGTNNKIKLKPKEKVKARNITNKLFCKIFEEYKIKNITAFGFKKNNEIIFSIKIMTSGRISNKNLYPATIFKTKSLDHYEAEMQEYLANVIPTLGI